MKTKPKFPLSPERWAYLKGLQLKARYIHYSCMAKMVPKDPAWPKGPQIPWVERPGVTHRMYRQNKRADKKYEFWRRYNGKHIAWLLNMPSVYTDERTHIWS